MKPFGWIAALTVGIGSGPGCREDARLADAAIKPAVVVDVTDEGLTLDAHASPEMVAFVLLRAIKADVEAADPAAREAAFDRQYRLAAPAAIHQRHVLSFGAEHADRDESVYKTVRAWAPVLAHYLDNFALGWDEAQKSLRTVSVPAGARDNVTQAEETHVLMEVRDPHDDPQASAVVRIRLVQESNRWRVWWVGFDHARRHLAAAKPPATQPAG